MRLWILFSSELYPIPETQNCGSKPLVAWNSWTGPSFFCRMCCFAYFPFSRSSQASRLASFCFVVFCGQTDRRTPLRFSRREIKKVDPKRFALWCSYNHSKPKNFCSKTEMFQLLVIASIFKLKTKSDPIWLFCKTKHQPFEESCRKAICVSNLKVLVLFWKILCFNC